mgnify:CR=1 FL=1
MSQSEINNDVALQGNNVQFSQSSSNNENTETSMSVDSIKSAITTAVRPSLYTVQFGGAHPRNNDQSLQVVINKISTPAFSRKLSTLTEEITWPGKTYSTQPSIVANNPAVKMPYTATYTGEITATFQIDKENQIMNHFQKWHELIMSRDQTQLSYYYDYCCPSLTITQMTTNGEPWMSVLVEEIWPESIRERTYGHNLANSLTKFTVSFSFKKWTYLQGFGQVGELTNNLGQTPQFGDTDEYGSLIGG